jgi:hypothetical protein
VHLRGISATSALAWYKCYKCTCVVQVLQVHLRGKCKGGYTRAMLARLRMRVWVWVSIHVWTCTYVYVCVYCMYVYTDSHIHTCIHAPDTCSHMLVRSWVHRRPRSGHIRKYRDAHGSAGSSVFGSLHSDSLPSSRMVRQSFVLRYTYMLCTKYVNLCVDMCVCVCACINTCMHACIYTHTSIHVCTYTHKRKKAYLLRPASAIDLDLYACMLSYSPSRACRMFKSAGVRMCLPACDSAPDACSCSYVMQEKRGAS